MNDEQLLRYSRQMMLPEIDASGQQKLLDAHVLIVGLGGLGSPASMYLASAGVGQITLVDFDTVDISNLQRQIVHSTADIDRLKIDSARDSLLAINPDITINSLSEKLEGETLQEQINEVDVVLDCSDNFTTRFQINAACVASKTPLVSAAAIRFEAQISVFDLRDDESPCYRCLYNEETMIDMSCTANGVIAPLLGVAGSIQAIEAMKLIMDLGETLKGRLLMIDGKTMQFQTARLRPDPECPVCQT